MYSRFLDMRTRSNFLFFDIEQLLRILKSHHLSLSWPHISPITSSHKLCFRVQKLVELICMRWRKQFQHIRFDMFSSCIKFSSGFKLIQISFGLLPSFELPIVQFSPPIDMHTILCFPILKESKKRCFFWCIMYPLRFCLTSQNRFSDLLLIWTTYRSTLTTIPFRKEIIRQFVFINLDTIDTAFRLTKSTTLISLMSNINSITQL